MCATIGGGELVSEYGVPPGLCESLTMSPLTNGPATGRVTDVERRTGITVVLGQQLIVAVRILAAAGVLAGHRDLLVPRIGCRPAGRLRRFIVLNRNRETARSSIARSVDSSTGHRSDANREDGTGRIVARQVGETAIGRRHYETNRCRALARVICRDDVGGANDRRERRIDDKNNRAADVRSPVAVGYN